MDHMRSPRARAKNSSALTLWFRRNIVHVVIRTCQHSPTFIECVVNGFSVLYFVQSFVVLRETPSRWMSSIMNNRIWVKVICAYFRSVSKLLAFCIHQYPRWSSQFQKEWQTLLDTLGVAKGEFSGLWSWMLNRTADSESIEVLPPSCCGQHDSAFYSAGYEAGVQNNLSFKKKQAVN